MQTVPALPLVALTVLSEFRTCDMNQERVGRNLGANRLAAFMQVTMPQIRFPGVSGALFAFISSFDATVDSLFISCDETTTPARHMLNTLRDQADPTISAISIRIIIMSIVLLLAAQLFGLCR